MPQAIFLTDLPWAGKDYVHFCCEFPRLGQENGLRGDALWILRLHTGRLPWVVREMPCLWMQQ